jgi:hypothetical protein
MRARAGKYDCCLAFVMCEFSVSAGITTLIFLQPFRRVSICSCVGDHARR